MSKARIDLRLPDGEVFQLHPATDPVPEGRLAEGMDVHLVTTHPPETDVYALQLSLNDQPLVCIAKSPTCAWWPWSIGFHAGTAELKLVSPGEAPLQVTVTTDPATAKLTRDDYLKMIGDIIDDSLAIASIAGHKVGFDRGLDRPPEIARFEYLSRWFSRMEHAVREIDRAPWLNGERHQKMVPFGHGGITTPMALARALRSAKRLPDAELDRLEPSVRKVIDRLGGRYPEMVSRTILQTDNRRREHSDMLAVLHMWQGFLARVQKSLDRLERERRPAPPLMRKRVTGMLQRLMRLTTLPLFDGVKPTYGGIQTSHVFRRVPAYRTFHETYRAFMAGIGDIAGDFMDIPVNRTYDLYEFWSFLRILRAASGLLGAEGWKETLEDRMSQGCLTVKLDAKPFKFGPYRLTFQPTYGEIWKVPAPAVGSYSRPMNPDIAIDVEAPGKWVPTVILDAKYRVEQALDSAIASTHMYKDALVMARAGGVMEHPIRSAFLLTPNREVRDRGAEWRESDSPEVFFQKGYHREYRFGAISMRPGMGVSQVQELLASVLPPIPA
ncbi:DUF2357 domain-containing protein [Geothrix sp.]|jgi:hypothetical protein|uniref:DUF2357 domain-containing protein n=1 Tax=Geothrix sp. TaxID=1962974 RepID=UPI0025BF6379|nr:DUF2357 domain-containing protein [Geothrix sp.]